ncbi:phytanoyl-CoA dioxygenase family protein [Fimbriimonas ginsengisoli]|uniref:Phytanoyl-CoA dioxygenase n=1 Tax=Fimbriimonas ginsengisoli Gsoil 348 TaxID=661478 RepID=A0A068NIT7_FIMGI|nr:phytanoyl-CoA dioxygenase family protein [Fimbriimonas ginsengisoli]AIE83387.1 Phytanoyl-CoA dioxygenase [Fimbriimonas ginsengisoli Gsoil 348]
MPNPWLSDLARDGIVTVPDVLPHSEVESLIEHIRPLVGEGAGDRTLHDDFTVRELATAGALGRLASQVLNDARVVRVLYFDKHPGANWKVPYHQDVTIAVQSRADVPGFTAFSVKAGMNHVRAPSEVLSSMVALRLHLDDCGLQNGPLRAVPGSHLLGKLPKSEALRLVTEHGEQTYTSPPGGVILMRPLTLHASSQAESPSHRRVLHVEYASRDLPKPLIWALGWPVRA